MLQRTIGAFTVVAAVALAFLLQGVSPSTAGPFGVFGVFVLIYLVAVGLLSFFIYGLSRGVRALMDMMISRSPWRALTFRRAYYYASIIGAAPVILIGMMSVSSVGIYEVILVGIFAALGCFYIARRGA